MTLALEPWNAHEWLTLPEAEVRRLEPASTHPAIKVMFVQDEDEPLPALRAAIIEEYPEAVVVYTTGPSFRSHLEGDKLIKQAFCYVAAFSEWKDAADALEQGMRTR